MRQCFDGFVRHASLERMAAAAVADSSRHDRLLQHVLTLTADYHQQLQVSRQNLLMTALKLHQAALWPTTAQIHATRDLNFARVKTEPAGFNQVSTSMRRIVGCDRSFGLRHAQIQLQVVDVLMSVDPMLHSDVEQHRRRNRLLAAEHDLLCTSTENININICSIELK